MRIHRNAKTTPAARAALVHRVLHEDWTYAETAAAFAVSARTVAKWVRRFRVGGTAALEDASSRPGPAPHQTPARVVTQMRELRVAQGLPAWAIARTLGRPRSTVSAWLRRLGISRPPARPAVPVQRYEWPRPGDLLHRGYQAAGPDPCGRAPHPWRPPTDRARRRLGVCACRGRRSQSGRLRRSAAGPARRHVCRLSPAQCGVVRRPPDHGPSRDERQRQRVCVPPVHRHVPDPRTAPSPHATLHPADQRQSGALHPNAAPRVGLHRGLSVIGESAHPTPTLSSGSTTADARTRAWTISHRGLGSRVLPNEQRTCTQQLVA